MSGVQFTRTGDGFSDVTFDGHFTARLSFTAPTTATEMLRCARFSQGMAARAFSRSQQLGTVRAQIDAAKASYHARRYAAIASALCIQEYP